MKKLIAFLIITQLCVFSFYNKSFAQCGDFWVAPCIAGEIEIHIHVETDAYGYETSWVIYDNTLGGPGCGIDPWGTDCGFGASGLADNTTYDWYLCAQAGHNITFYIADDYGDGMSIPNTTYSVDICGGTVVASGGGNFGCYDVTTFTLPADCGVTPGPPNQYCVDAIDMCDPQTITGTTNGALNEPLIDPPISIWSCNAVYDNYVFYTFTTDAVGSTVSINMTFDCGGSYLQTGIFDVPPFPCQNADLWSNSLFCTESTSAYTITASGLQPNTLYYIIVDQWPGNPCDFTLQISGNGPCYVCPSAPGTPADQDCINAIPICEDWYCQENSYSGQGAIDDEIDSGPSCLGSGEKNDAWYTLTVEQSGNLSFTIFPNDGTDDYDWAVYNLSDANCSDIFTDASLEVSCNYSANIGCNGLTGPNGETVNCAGQNEAVIPVSIGETYVINVSNYSSTQSGYVLDLSASTAVIFDNVPPVISSLVSSPSCGSTSITFQFSENVLCSSVQNCDFTLTGPAGPYILSGVTGAACSIGGTQEDVFTINVSPALTASGAYNLNLVAGCGFVEDLCGNIAPPGSLPFNITGINAAITSFTNATCNGLCNGSASASGSGGTAPYTYTWSGGLGTGANKTNICAGTYWVTVTDANGCSAVTFVNITQPLILTINATSTNESCNGACDGTVSATAGGGVGGYSYLWSGGLGAGANHNNVCDGTYWVTVTDVNGCTATDNTTVSPGVTVTAGFTYDGNHCPGEPYNFTNTGSSGGGVTYWWTFAGGNPATSTAQNPSVTFAASGTHTVTQTVTLGACSDVATIVITVYDEPNVNITPGNVNCNGACDGTATANASGGSGTYSYFWNNSQTTNPAVNLCPGVYSLTVTDTYGCTVTDNVAITEPGAITLNLTRTDVLCKGECTGTANVTVLSGGTFPFTYQWDNGAGTISNPTGLCANTYSVTVTDVNGCTATESIVVDEPATSISLIPSHTDATCGLSNGDASISAVGGTSPYTYLWSTTGTSSSISAIPSGAYTVTVTDDNDCTETETINVNDIGGPTASITSFDDPSCALACDGEATVTVSSGTPDYTYTWSSGSPTPVTTPSATNTIYNLCDGVHSVNITDNTDCSVSAFVTITDLPVLIASITLNNQPACNGECNGSATASATGGTGSYTYVWNDGPPQTNAATSNILCAGIYTVTVYDANLCTATATVTITDPPPVTANITASDNVSCNGVCDGSATVTPGGGTPSYTYLWCDGQTNSTATGLCAGICGVTVTDANFCTATTSVTITEPPLLTASITASNDVLCNGDCNGDATVAGSGGTGVGTYTYLWDDASSQTTTTANNLCSGTSNVTVTDANGCTATSPVTITEPPLLSANASVVEDANCGNADGSATVTASGGTGTYTYQWNDATNQTTQTAVNLLPQTYTVTVTDANGCTVTDNVTVNDLPAGTASISAFSNVTCFGSCDGSATASIGGGTPLYSYLWDDASSQTTATASNLCPNTYTITITDAYGCKSITNITITEPDTLSNIFDVENVNCYGACDGELTANPGGGDGNYTYYWVVGIPTANPTLSDLCAGTYTLTITDGNGCIYVDSVNITEPAPIILTADITEANCGQMDGAIDLTVTGGVAPFNFIWNPPFGTNEDLVFIAAGTYYVTVTDDKNCTATASFIVNNISGPTAIISDSSNVSCNGVCDGYATVIASDGLAPYTYQWDANAGNQITQTATNLCAGTYSVTVSDANSCNASVNVTISEPDLLEIFTFTGLPNCNGGCDGSASVVPIGGTAPYTFQWSGGSNPNDSLTSDLCAGAYNIVVTDALGCLIIQNVTVNDPPQITITTGSEPATCSGTGDGTATANPAGGTPIPVTGYLFQWDANTGDQTSQTAIGLDAGTYWVTVTDYNGCTESISVIVTTPNPIVIQIDEYYDLDCYLICNGYINTSVSGGTGSLTYSWSNGQSTQDITNLCADTYTLTVTDDNDCFVTTDVIISQPPELVAFLITNNETCCGYCDGSVIADVVGGSEPYNYLWSDLQTTPVADNLCPADYTLTLTDDNGCEQILNTTVTGPDLLELVILNIIDATCDSSDGSATIGVVGGTTFYTIEWSSGGNALTEDNLPAGTYFVTVTDENGCIIDTTISINNISAPVIDSIITTDIDCYGNNNGTAEVYFTGSAPPYTYLWNDAQTTTLVTGLESGSYSVSITDNNGCIASGFIYINEPALLSSAIISSTDVTCYGGYNGAAMIMAAGGTSPYTYSWENGDETQDTDSLYAANYNVTITDDNGCWTVNSVTISEPGIIVITGTVTDATCGMDNGTISVSVTGGSGSFLYNWLPYGGNTSVAASLAPGDYTVVVTDQNDVSCGADTGFTVIEANPIGVTTETINATCGGNNGVAYITSVTGTPPYTYIWSPGGSTNDTIFNLNPGTYQLQVFDSNGCDVIANVTVYNTPGPILQSIATTNVSCYGGNDGSALITIKLGTKPYTYDWSTAVGFDSIATNLSAGFYYVTVTDSNDCQVSTMFQITEPSPVFVHNNHQETICLAPGDSTNITVSASYGTPPYSFIWLNPEITDSSQAQIVSPDSGTIYSVYVIDKNNCISDTTTIIVDLYPQVNLLADVYSDCAPLTVKFNNAEIIPSVTYSWNFGDGNLSSEINPEHTYVDPGIYIARLYAASKYGCLISDNDTIKIYPNPDAEFKPIPEITSLFSATIEFFDQSDVDIFENSIGIEYWYWDFGDSQTAIYQTQDPFEHTYIEAGLYNIQLTVYTDMGCMDSITKSVNIKEEHTFWTPTAFTPGASGTNAYFYPEGRGIDTDEYHLYIYDRWGELIFETDIFEEHKKPLTLPCNGCWDGKAKDKRKFVEPGVYTWLVILKDLNGKTHEYAGSVTVIR